MFESRKIALDFAFLCFLLIPLQIPLVLCNGEVQFPRIATAFYRRHLYARAAGRAIFIERLKTAKILALDSFVWLGIDNKFH